MTGIGETHTLWEWFVHVVGPIEPYLTREVAYVGALLKGAEMALSGVTTVADMFCHAPGPEPSTPGVVRALERAGAARRRLLRRPGRQQPAAAEARAGRARGIGRRGRGLRPVPVPGRAGDRAGRPRTS